MKELSPFDMSTEWKALFLKSLVVEGDCWKRTNSFTRGGYSRRLYKGKLQLAHRLSWKIANGSIPAGCGYHGTCVLHKCDTRNCVRPEHLFLGSNADNVIDRTNKGRSSSLQGEKHPQVKLTIPKVIRIRLLAKTGLSHSKIASFYKLCRSTVSYIVNGKLWPHITEGL